MLSENIKRCRRAMGLSQEELAIKLNVVRQTVSKWERGLSVPDSDLLIALSDVLDTPVSTLLSNIPTVSDAETSTVSEADISAITGTDTFAVSETDISAVSETDASPISKANDLRAIAAKLEIINLQLARRKAALRTALTLLFVLLAAGVVAVFAILFVLNSPYQGWDFSDPETAIAGTAYHAFEWVFVQVAPLIFLGAVAGIILTRRNA